MIKPKITVVTVTFNCRETIRDTIESIINQTYKNLEYIIVDGLSTDGTLDIIDQYRSKIDLIKSEKDRGIFDAMNKAIDLCTGDWIIFMNAGDRFFSEEVISKIFDEVFEIRNLGVVFGDYVQLNKDRTQIYKAATPFFLSKKRYKKMGFNHQSVFVKSDYARELKFDGAYIVAADYNMIASLYRKGVEFKYINIPISICEEFGFSNKHKKKQINEIARINDLPAYVYNYQLFSNLLLGFKAKIKNIYTFLFKYKNLS